MKRTLALITAGLLVASTGASFAQTAGSSASPAGRAEVGNANANGPNQNGVSTTGAQTTGSAIVNVNRFDKNGQPCPATNGAAVGSTNNGSVANPAPGAC